ncbi:(deoxy)nucleoside triphosphate pyrophosphohydrolase [Microbacterium sp. No. 7]|uniref:(deoxy)nucleoside triphosphate pyrophosphohydrolase n=1 Tax=Microbacterium sp. No. 7 TaxID=1714373 RepID=UPI000A477668|nr:(deoxy)nucleoside triphosphate pyrophosphohydrolase [Microbacterium sp. No. 7]
MTPGIRAPGIHVVGAVIVRGGAVLCARRGGTGPLAGLWEFPGGKVEPGESHTGALVREIDEELGCGVRVGSEVTTTPHRTIVLTTYWCELVHGEPRALEHDEVRWVVPAELRMLEWTPADVPAAALVAAELGAA